MVKPAITIEVLDYSTWGQSLAARVKLRNAGQTTLVYRQMLSCPQGWLAIETSCGTIPYELWPIPGLVSVQMHLAPRSNALCTVVLPRGTQKWHFGFRVRGASLRERLHAKMAGARWVQQHSLFQLWRLLPASTQTEQDFRSEWFEVWPIFAPLSQPTDDALLEEELSSLGDSPPGFLTGVKPVSADLLLQSLFRLGMKRKELAGAI